VLKPVQVPATADRYGWERLRAYLVAREMETQGVPPHLAAEQADAQLDNAWRVKFPGEDFPLDLMAPTASAEGLPGGIKAGEALTWAIVAAPTPDGEYLTAAVIAELVSTYDPDFRRAPIVLPNGSGPVHTVGRWAPFVPGSVRALAHDGHHLWALIEDHGMVGFSVDFAGIRERSIAWRNPLRDLDPPAAYLEHVALVSAEMPGVPNMPSLDQYFLGERDGDAKSLTMTATLKDFPTREETQMAEKDKAAVAADPKDGEEAEVDTTDLGLDVAALAAALAPEVAKLLTAKPEPKAAEPSDYAAALTAAVAPLAAKVEALTGEITTMKTASATSAAETRKQRVADVLDRAVSEGRLTAAHRELEETALTDARYTDAEVTERLAKVSALPVTMSSQLTAAIEYVDGDKRMTVPPHLLPPPRYSADGADLERTARALSRVPDTITDPAQRYEAKRASIYREFGSN